MQLMYDVDYCAVALMCSAVGCCTDIQRRKIPNWLTGSTLLMAVIMHGVFDGWGGIVSALSAGLIAGTLFVLFHLAGGMGAGDVKLITGVAAMVGLGHMVFLLVFTSLAGGLMGIVVALVRGQLFQTIKNVGALTTHHKENGLTPHPEMNYRNGSVLRLPYGVAIAAGSLLTLCALRFEGSGL